MPEPDRSSYDRAALQRLLRRRGRRGKAGANSGEPIKGWAEYQSVSLQPTGSPSQFFRWLVLIPTILLASIIAIITIWSMIVAAILIIEGDVRDFQEWIGILLTLTWPFLLVGGVWCYKKLDGD